MERSNDLYLMDVANDDLLASALMEVAVRFSELVCSFDLNACEAKASSNAAYASTGLFGNLP